MIEFNLKPVGDTIVLHLRKEQHTINAYALATTLVSLADAAKDANQQINPGYEIEVVVEALADGSFKAKISAVYNSLENLFTKQTLKTIVLSVIAAYIYENTLSPDKSVRVVVNTDEVIIEQDDKRIIVPREVHEAEQQVKKSSNFQDKIGTAFHAILKDPDIDSISIDPDVTPGTELPPISREDLERIAIPPTTEDDHQIVDEIAELQIIRAILEKSRRRWEFSWKGFRIPAPILDTRFYENFTSHRITIAPGDKLKAKLRIYQKKEPSTGVYINERYEVIEVLEHEAAPKHIQSEMQS